MLQRRKLHDLTIYLSPPLLQEGTRRQLNLVGRNPTSPLSVNMDCFCAPQTFPEPKNATGDSRSSLNGTVEQGYPLEVHILLLKVHKAHPEGMDGFRR